MTATFRFTVTSTSLFARNSIRPSRGSGFASMRLFRVVPSVISNCSSDAPTVSFNDWPNNNTVTILLPSRFSHIPTHILRWVGPTVAFKTILPLRMPIGQRSTSLSDMTLRTLRLRHQCSMSVVGRDHGIPFAWRGQHRDEQHNRQHAHD